MTENLAPSTEASRAVTPRLDSLTGLRIFAALAVVGYHTNGNLRETSQNIFSAGNTGVSFFYIVSGFVLAWTARPKDTKSAFYMRRVARIYPLFVTVWAMSLALRALDGDKLGWQDYFSVSLLQAWIPDADVYYAGRPVFWSLSCEAFFYLMFPLIFPLLSGLRDNTRRFAILGAATLMIALPSILSPIAAEPGVEIWFLQVFPPVRMLEFILGALLAIEARRGTTWSPGLAPAIAVAVAAQVAATTLASEAFSFSAVTIAPFALLVWAAAHADLRGERSFLRWKWIVTLGVWSYAVYLVHPNVIAAAAKLTESAGLSPTGIYEPEFGVLLAIVLVGSTIAAAALHRLVEAPAEKRLRPRSIESRLDG